MACLGDLVYCKDCKWFNADRQRFKCDFSCFDVNENDFCSRGEFALNMAKDEEEMEVK